MNKIIVVVAIVFLAFPLEARTVRTKGYIRKKSGTYVSPHYKTAPNRTQRDNYSSKGNVNPYTGKEGTMELKK